VIAASIPLLMVAAVFQLSDGIQAVGAGVLRGAADTRFAFIANLIGHWLIGLPVALYLGFHRQMGIVGLWWGLCAGLTAVAVLLFIRFERRSGGLIAPVGDPRVVEEV
jgi:multidrug resistance protein, MATE family